MAERLPKSRYGYIYFAHCRATLCLLFYNAPIMLIILYLVIFKSLELYQV